MIKKLSKKQSKDLQNGKLPDRWWDYGINPVAGYRVYPSRNSLKPISNSLPLPKTINI